MYKVIDRVEAFAVRTPLSLLNATSLVFTAVGNGPLGTKRNVEDIIQTAINVALVKINDDKRKLHLHKISKKIGDGYDSIFSLRELGALCKDDENFEERSQTEIRRNIDQLLENLTKPPTDENTELNFRLANNLRNTNINTLKWEDPLSSQIISDNSIIFNTLPDHYKQQFLELATRMKPPIPTAVEGECYLFADAYQVEETSETEDWTVREIWKNPVYRDLQKDIQKDLNENGYLTDVVMPLIRAALKKIPHYKCIRVTTSEKESKSSKARRLTQGSGKIGKKPDAMCIATINGFEFEIMFLEGSRLITGNNKFHDDDVKLWREGNDGMWHINNACKPKRNDFAVINIQVFKNEMALNVLVKDINGIGRYYHLDKATIPLVKSGGSSILQIVRLLLTLRNIIIVDVSLLYEAMKHRAKSRKRGVKKTSTTTLSPKRRKK
nr:9295_t:CDS:2 [Entrophospora candida]